MKTRIILLVLCAAFSSCGIFGLFKKKHPEVKPDAVITLPAAREKPNAVRTVRNAFSAEYLTGRADGIRAGRAKRKAVARQAEQEKEDVVYGTTPVFFEPVKHRADTAQTTITVKAGNVELFKVSVKQKKDDNK